MTKISISIPEEILKALEEYANEEGISRSKAIANILSSFLSDRIKIEEGKYPTVLWKLKKKGFLKIRSPRRVGRMIKDEWIVEEF